LLFTAKRTRDSILSDWVMLI